MLRTFAEWEEQSFVMLMFPHKDSDWKNSLNDVLTIFENIATTIAKYQDCLVCYKDQDSIKNIKNNRNITFKRVDSNDTWCRDFGAISIKDNNIKLLDFIFNGWGNKFDSNLDNLINSKIFKNLEKVDFILEGGSIDSNTKNTILTTSECLLNNNRNSLPKKDIEDKLGKYLGAKEIIWLNNGSLVGDDTDSHIDMLARFVNDNTIVYTTASKNDENYNSLKKMEEELLSLKDRFNLISLPNMPKIYYNNQRLPTSYANFLIINGAVLLPIYNDKQDEKAISLFKELFPDRVIEPIDCSKIVIQGGSLHCLTMQFYTPLFETLS